MENLNAKKMLKILENSNISETIYSDVTNLLMKRGFAQPKAYNNNTVAFTPVGQMYLNFKKLELPNSTSQEAKNSAQILFDTINEINRRTLSNRLLKNNVAEFTLGCGHLFIVFEMGISGMLVTVLLSSFIKDDTISSSTLDTDVIKLDRFMSELKKVI